MDVRVLIPRVRRAIDGPTALTSGAPSATLTDDEVSALVADAIADVIFYTEGRWGHTITGTDPDSYGAPTSYTVDPDLTLPEQTVVVVTAAFNFFFREFRTLKVQESLADEARSWSYSLSANVLTEQFKALKEARDRALDLILATNSAYVAFHSFIAVRDACTAAIIEPYTDDSFGGGGQEIDFRFLGP